MRFDADSAFALLRQLREPVICIDRHGIIIFANEAALSLMGTDAVRAGASISGVLAGDWPSLTDPQGPDRLTVSLSTTDGCVETEIGLTRWQQKGETLIGLTLRPQKNDALASQAHLALAEARLAHNRLRDIIDMLPQAVCVFDAQDRYVLWNRKYAETYPEIADLLEPGVAFADILRASISSGDMRESVEDSEKWLAQRLAKHALMGSQEEQQLRDGCWLRHDDRRLADGGAIGMRIDITELKRKEASFRMLFEDNPVPMLIFEPQTLRIRAVNAAAIALYGFSREEFLSKSAPDLHLDNEAVTAQTTFGAVEHSYNGRMVWCHKTAAGQDLHVLIFIRSVIHEQGHGLLTVVADVTDRVQAEAQVHHLAHHDALTGLANRFSFQKELERSVSHRAPGRDVVLYCLDLDEFKPINDTFGHGGGDQVLRLVAARLRESVREGDFVARLGGDEFAILTEAGSTDRNVVASRLIDAFRAPFEIGDQSVRVGISLGFAVAPRDAKTADSLLVAADTALYAAKRAGRNTWRAHKRRLLAKVI